MFQRSLKATLKWFIGRSSLGENDEKFLRAQQEISIFVCLLMAYSLFSRSAELHLCKTT